MLQKITKRARTPEREALAQAVADNVAYQDELKKARQAAAALEAQRFAAVQAEWAAETAVQAAIEAEREHLLALARGEPSDAPQTPTEARAALSVARDRVRALTPARDAANAALEAVQG